MVCRIFVLVLSRGYQRFGHFKSYAENGRSLGLWNKSAEKGLFRGSRAFASQQRQLITPEMFFFLDTVQGAGHVGLVKSVQRVVLQKIEGNTTDKSGSRERIGVFERNVRKIPSIDLCFEDMTRKFQRSAESFLADSRPTKWHWRRWATNAAGKLRLIRTAAMFNAIREAGVHGNAAEMKVSLAGVSHWPSAYALVQVEQRGFASHFGAWLGGHQTARWSRGDRCLLVTWPLSHEATRADRDDTWHSRGCAFGLRFGGCGRAFHSARWRCKWSGHAWLNCFWSSRWLGRGFFQDRLLFSVIRLHWRGTGFQSQTMRFTDYCIAADPAKLVGDLTRGQALFPKGLQLIYPLVSPSHICSDIFFDS